MFVMVLLPWSGIAELFQSLVRQNVPGDADGQENEEAAQGPVLSDEDGAVQQGEP